MSLPCHDAGTTRDRTVRWSRTGNPLAWSYREVFPNTSRSRDGGADPEEIWRATVERLAETNKLAAQGAAVTTICNHQPARDRRRVGPAQGRPLHRAIGGRKAHGGVVA